MPYDFKVDRERHRVTGLLWGDIDADQIVRLARRLQADRSWVPDMKQLWDCRQVTRLYLLPKDIDDLRESLRGVEGERGYYAVIISTDGPHRIAGELLRVYAHRNEITVFTALEEAEAWMEGGKEAEIPP